MNSIEIFPKSPEGTWRFERDERKASIPNEGIKTTRRGRLLVAFLVSHEAEFITGQSYDYRSRD
jgi:hypothetical protein